MPNTKPDPAQTPDDDNPEWTDQMFAQAQPAAAILPRFIGQNATDELIRRKPGRPRQEIRKINQTIRLDADVLDAYREHGKGWQRLINDVLRRNMPGGGNRT